MLDVAWRMVVLQYQRQRQLSTNLTKGEGKRNELIYGGTMAIDCACEFQRLAASGNEECRIYHGVNVQHQRTVWASAFLRMDKYRGRTKLVILRCTRDRCCVRVCLHQQAGCHFVPSSAAHRPHIRTFHSPHQGEGDLRRVFVNGAGRSKGVSKTRFPDRRGERVRFARRE